ncbi:MAG: hypothetical protein HZB33_12930 [Nitrospirae bacterium]|nr:hypothetical protein [Nitrospirota bacterium]
MENTKHRTQISLEDWQYHMLLEISKKTRKSLSGIIRDLVTEHLSGKPHGKGGDPILKLIGAGAGDGAPVAREHDRYLYGRKK